MKHRLLVILGVPFVMVALSQSAWAQMECDSDADCIDGFVCESMGASTCAVVCTPDGECDEDPTCEPEEFSACVPGPCTSDADCSEGMRCLELEYIEGCAEPMPAECIDGEECHDLDPMPPEDCGDVITESFCLPEWIGPCETAEDCGEGFECVADEICTCSGSGAIPCPYDDPDCDSERFADPDWEDECSCETTDDTYCRPSEIECTEDAECPEEWTCETFPTSEPCWVDEDGAEHCGDEVPVDAPDGFCMPPYFDDLGWGAGSGGSEAGVDFEDVLDAATGGGGARPTGHNANDDGGQGVDGGRNGCQAAPGAAGGASAALWLLPLLLGLLLRRK
jgi:hypothetical protein